MLLWLVMLSMHAPGSTHMHRHGGNKGKSSAVCSRTSGVLSVCVCALTIILQEKSYFALRLPAGWWVFGLDLALVGDIDMCQYRYDERVNGVFSRRDHACQGAKLGQHASCTGHHSLLHTGTNFALDHAG